MNISIPSIASQQGSEIASGNQSADSHLTGASSSTAMSPSSEPSQSSPYGNISTIDTSLPPSTIDNQRTLFLGDLPKFCNEDRLFELLCPFGAVESVYMKKNKRDGTSLGYGFVTLSSRSEATAAMEALNGTMFGGRNLKVKWGMKREELSTNTTGGLPSPSSAGSDEDATFTSPGCPSAVTAKSSSPTSKERPEVINSLYVCFNAENSKVHINEETLHKAFSKFGHIEDVTIKASEIDKDTGCQSGYGFVQFSNSLTGIQAAYDNICALHLATVASVLYQCEPSNNLLKLLKQMNLVDQDIKPQAKIPRAVRKSPTTIAPDSSSNAATTATVTAATTTPAAAAVTVAGEKSVPAPASVVPTPDAVASVTAAAAVPVAVSAHDSYRLPQFEQSSYTAAPLQQQQQQHTAGYYHVSGHAAPVSLPPYNSHPQHVSSKFHPSHNWAPPQPDSHYPSHQQQQQQQQYYPPHQAGYAASRVSIPHPSASYARYGQDFYGQAPMPMELMMPDMRYHPMQPQSYPQHVHHPHQSMMAQAPHQRPRQQFPKRSRRHTGQSQPSGMSMTLSSFEKAQGGMPMHHQPTMMLDTAHMGMGMGMGGMGLGMGTGQPMSGWAANKSMPLPLEMSMSPHGMINGHDLDDDGYLSRFLDL